MNQDITASIVLITSSNPELRGFGTGFIIHQNEGISYVLTCAHVVAEVGDSGKVNVKVDGHLATEVANGDRYGCDLAVLAVEGGLSQLPALKLGAVGEEGREFVTSGYFISAKTHRLEDIKGKLGGIGLINKEGDRALSWNLEISEDSKHKLKDGYSGSPVVDKSSSYVLGVVSQRAGEKEGLAISIEALEKVWLDKPPSIIINFNSKISISTGGFAKFTARLKRKQEELARKENQLKKLQEQIDPIEQRRNTLSIVEKYSYEIRLEDLSKESNRITEEIEKLQEEVEQIEIIIANK
jgi:hypothetical protein